MQHITDGISREQKYKQEENHEEKSHSDLHLFSDRPTTPCFNLCRYFIKPLVSAKSLVLFVLLCVGSLCVQLPAPLPEKNILFFLRGAEGSFLSWSQNLYYATIHINSFYNKDFTCTACFIKNQKGKSE